MIQAMNQKDVALDMGLSIASGAVRYKMYDMAIKCYDMIAERVSLIS